MTGQRDFLDPLFAGIGPEESGIAIQEDKLVFCPEIQQGAHQTAGIDLYPAAVLVVVPQHDPDAHVCSREDPSGKLHGGQHGGPAVPTCSAARRRIQLDRHRAVIEPAGLHLRDRAYNNVSADPALLAP
jgi:hypothetical protein